MTRIRAVIVVLLLLAGWQTQAQDAPPLHTPVMLNTDAPYLRAPRLGINHISLTNEPTSETRYHQALTLGASWNRWPLYWDQVQPQPGEFHWDNYDRLVINDLRHGLHINAILLGRPGFAQDGVRVKGINTPIYSDGTDTPRPGKTLNPNNPWVHFAQAAVERYRPGGALAQAQGWRGDEGIRVWEIWNEPDYPAFWEASISDYARLLKISYIVIKQADPHAQVMFGGLLYNTDDNWLARVLAILENDPLREDYNWYMDMVGVHNYGYPWRSGWLVLYVRQTLAAYGLKRPIWLNESGAPVWDDYPGPLWASSADDRLLRATLDQQAAFFIQSSAYAWAEGADVVFFHQLYDDCGNQPAGTDFRYHQGELCRGDALCAGDAFGLFRNERGALCFSHHPYPGTPRPAAAAYQLVASVFGRAQLDNPLVFTAADKVTIITFDEPTRRERIYVIWNRTLRPQTLALPAAGERAALYLLGAQGGIEPDRKGLYHLELPPATPDSYPGLQPGDATAVGGAPLIVVEPVRGAFPPVLEQLQAAQVKPG
jgi:hypothetical protein